MRISKLSLIGIVLLVALASVGVASACKFACTPGFWKNSPNQWACGFDPDDPLDIGDGDLNNDGAEDTIMDALSFKGGPDDEAAQRILLKHGIAATLNLCYFEEDYIPGGDIWPWDDFEYFLFNPDGQRDGMLELAGYFDETNNNSDDGCPLSADASFKE